MIQLPEKPWEKDDTFTVEETGVVFTFDGEKWLAANGEEFDGDLYATKAFVDQVESASVFRDETLKTNLEDKDQKLTAAIVVVESDVQNETQNRKNADQELQDQIDAIEIPDAPSIEPNAGDKAGSLNWVDYTFSGDTIDALSKQARIHPERTKMALNKDLIEGGNRNWTNLFDPYPSVIGMELNGTIHRVVVESTGPAGQNSRSHCFKIIEHDLPIAAQDPSAKVGIYPDYEDPSIDLSGYLSRGGDSMNGGKLFGTDRIGPASASVVQYEPKGESGHPNSLVNQGMMWAAIEAIEIPEASETSKSIATAQMMMQPHPYWDMAAGKFTLVQQDGTSPTLSPTGAHGFRCYPHPDEWFVESHEFIVGGYISILDPYTGKVQFAGRVESVEKDLTATNRWTFMMNDRYQWGDNLNADGQFLITLTGCLREL